MSNTDSAIGTKPQHVTKESEAERQSGLRQMHGTKMYSRSLSEHFRIARGGKNLVDIEDAYDEDQKEKRALIGPGSNRMTDKEVNSAHPLHVAIKNRRNDLHT